MFIPRLIHLIMKVVGDVDSSLRGRYDRVGCINKDIISVI